MLVVVLLRTPERRELCPSLYGIFVFWWWCWRRKAPEHLSGFHLDPQAVMQSIPTKVKSSQSTSTLNIGWKPQVWWNVELKSISCNLFDYGVGSIPQRLYLHVRFTQSLFREMQLKLIPNMEWMRNVSSFHFLTGFCNISCACFWISQILCSNLSALMISQCS